MRAPEAIAAASAVLVLAGCATKIDTSKAERFIDKTVRTQVGAKVASVECPDGKTAKQGDSFTCVVTGSDGTKGKAFVTERDDKGNVHVSAPFIHTREIETSIADGLRRKLHDDITVGCPEIIVARKAGRFSCRATDSHGKRAHVQVVQSDALGHVNYRLVP